MEIVSKTEGSKVTMEITGWLDTQTAPQLEKELEAEEEKVKNQDLSLVHESVTEEEIARIISRWTGIPVIRRWQARKASGL